MSEPITVLAVDDDLACLELIQRGLRGFGFEIETSSSSLGVSNLIRTTKPQIVLLDVNIPALKGNALLEVARRYAPAETKFILYSATDEAELRRLAKECGADGYITKSADIVALADYLRARVDGASREA